MTLRVALVSSLLVTRSSKRAPTTINNHFPNQTQLALGTDCVRNFFTFEPYAFSGEHTKGLGNHFERRRPHYLGALGGVRYQSRLTQCSGK